MPTPENNPSWAGGRGITVIGLAEHSGPPNSSTAICAAVTEPFPLGATPGH